MSPPARGPTQPVELLFRAFRKHWLLGLLVVLTVTAAMVFYTMGQKRIYRATATLQIDPDPPRPLGKDVQTVVDMGAGAYWSNKEYFATQHKILGGREVVRMTVRALGLQNDGAFMANTAKGQKAPRLPMTPSVDDAADVLQSRLRVEPIRESRLAVVSIEDANPERARHILSTHLDIYLERNVDLVVNSTVAASSWLRDQTQKLKGELEKSELALHDYKRDKRILSVSLDDQSNMLRGEMQQLNEALTRVSAKREELKARVAEIDKVNPADPTTLPASELLSSTLLSTLRQDYMQAKSDLGSLMGYGKGEKHPDVVGASARVEATRQALTAEVTNVQGALHGDLEAVSREATGLSSLFEQAKQRAMDLNMLEIEFRRLERSKDNTEKLYGLVLERSKESDLTGMLRFNNITIAEQPTAERYPIRPRVPLNLGIGLALGLVMGIAAAFSREWLDQTIRAPEDVEDEVGIPLLGLLPALTGRTSKSSYYSPYYGRSRRRNRKPEAVSAEDVPPELVAHALPTSNAAESARVIRTSLTFASPDKPYRTILVTSPSPSEGKTTVASTIAVAFAQAGQRVLIVDCDLRRARLHRVFKVPNSVGVSTVLQDPASLETAISPTEVPNLSLLVAGPHIPNPAELLHSESFSRLLTTLAQQFDRVIIDSPPMLVVTDAAVLASRADATVLVVRVKKTKRALVKRVAHRLAEVGATIAGTVLNGMEDRKRKGSYYYYGYYGKDTYGYRSDSANA